MPLKHYSLGMRSLFKSGGGGGQDSTRAMPHRACWILSGNFFIHRKSGGHWPCAPPVLWSRQSNVLESFTKY